MKVLLKVALPTSLAALALGMSPVAMAQTFDFKGSDTLTDVINQSIINSGMSSQLTYTNTGSGQGEKNLAQLTGQNTYQSIAPMSRNLTQAALNVIPNAAPTSKNVVGLDAAVIISRNFNGRCKDLTTPLQDPTDPTLAAPDSILSLVMGGPTSMTTGTTAACASPQRLTAIDTLTSCTKQAQLAHFYRRDDNSGTSDTMKERLQMPRYCNGRAPGNFNAPGSNMKNDDQDPVRRACVPADATHARTNCTYYPTNVTCAAGDPADSAGHPCTQGFLVPLSENDPGSPDITVSIANRVKADTFNTTMGFAGREAVRQPSLPTLGVTINTINFSDTIVRLNQYMLSRRLFLQRNPDYLTSPATGDAARFAVETSFFNWATTRCNMNPIITQFGFITCLDNCNLEPSGAGNLCSLPATVAGASTSPALPVGAACSSNICSSTGATCSTGTCPAPAGLASGFACSVGGDCASGTCVAGSNPLAGTCT
jgi:hypothetical protein